MSEQSRRVTAERLVRAEPTVVFELIADPAQQPRWDGNDNLAEAVDARRVTGVGQIFAMRLTVDTVRENHVVDFEEGRRVAWKPSPVGEEPYGHLWAWELEPTAEPGVTLVRHIYDWSGLPDTALPMRLERARNTTAEKLRASIDRLAELAEAQ
ncbi:MAG: SRPBCC family protein [Leucobacter sp.]